jgi:hypothetical protein
MRGIIASNALSLRERSNTAGHPVPSEKCRLMGSRVVAEWPRDIAARLKAAFENNRDFLLKIAIRICPQY